MNPGDRDVRLGWFLLVLGGIITWASFTLPMRGEFIESPGIFPGLSGLLLVLFSAILIVRAIRSGGRIRLGRWLLSIGPFLKDEGNRPVLLGILLPALYIFAAIPILGFYQASAIFLAVMFYFFVPRWRRWGLFLVVSAVLTVLLYLVFNVLFMVQIK